MKASKIISFIFVIPYFLFSLVGCQSQEAPTQEKKNIVTTDFVTYDVTKNLIKDSEFTVDMISISDELSGRDKNKINNSVLFINTEDLSKINGIDETVNKLEIKDFIEQKENDSSENKIYSENINFIRNDSSSSSEENTSNNQIIINPNHTSSKDDNTTSEAPNKTDDNKNSSSNNNSGNSSNAGNNNNNSSSKPDNSSSEDKNNNNTQNSSSEEDEKGLVFVYAARTVGDAPCSSDLKGKTISSMEPGYEILGDADDKYQDWIYQRIKSLTANEDSGDAQYAVLDIGNGNYKVFCYSGGFLPRYKVLNGIEDIYVSMFGTTVYAESSLEGVLSGYATAATRQTKQAFAKTTDISTSYWLDVDNTILLAQKIKESLIEIDPSNKEKYEENYKSYESDLLSLDDKIQYIVDNSKNKMIFIGGPFKYKYLTDGYGINYISIYDYNTEEASLTRLNNFAKIVNKYNIKYIIKDPLSSSEGIDSIRTEVSHNINTVIIDTMEKVDNPDSTSYLEIMNNNYIILKKSLY